MGIRARLIQHHALAPFQPPSQTKVEKHDIDFTGMFYLCAISTSGNLDTCRPINLTDLEYAWRK